MLQTVWYSLTQSKGGREGEIRKREKENKPQRLPFL
jgi:hypothetical protein